MPVVTWYTTNKRSSSNVKSLMLQWGFFPYRLQMKEGHFYYLSDQYFSDFKDEYLMKNKENIDGQSHDRPCFYAFLDENTGLYWMIPISHNVDKYRVYYEQKIKKYGRCDTIVFGDVLGHEKAF